MRYVILILALLSLFACGQVIDYQPTVFPAESWVEKTPGEMGIDPEKMADALRFLESECGEDGLEEVVMARKGVVVFKGDSIYKIHESFESGQVFTSAVMGIMTDWYAIDEMTLARSIDTALAHGYPELRFKHLATMTSGFHGGDTYEIGAPLFAPGEAFDYAENAQKQFARLLTINSTISLKDRIDESFGQAIGLGQYQWETEGEVNGVPINKGSRGLLVNADQMARFAHFFLNEGHWNGRQLLSRYWIVEATTNQVFANTLYDGEGEPIDGRGRYGYNWWVNGTLPNGSLAMPNAPKSLYYSAGDRHNVCFVIPEWEMVFVRRGMDRALDKGIEKVYDEFFRRLAPAIDKE